MCRQAFSENHECSDRFTAVIDALVTWLAENPRAARLYFGDGADSGGLGLIRQVQSAKESVTSALVELIATCGRVEHRTRVEFVIGAVRHIIRQELRKETIDPAHLAHQLTRLAPLLDEFACQAHG